MFIFDTIYAKDKKKALDKMNDKFCNFHGLWLLSGSGNLISKIPGCRYALSTHFHSCGIKLNVAT
jgi:hypothetical protein